MSAAEPLPGAAFERITEALNAIGSTQKGKMWHCPAHDDRTPSLSVTSREGRAKVKCFADCEDEDVLHALGLSVKDLYDEPLSKRDEPPAQPRAKRAKAAPKPEKWEGKVYSTLDDLHRVAEWKATRNLGEGACVVATYSYDHPDETKPRLVVFRVERKHEDGNIEKTFLQGSPEGDGWKLSLQGVELIPYKLQNLRDGIKAGYPVYIVEGEKDVHAIEKAFGVATCNPMGSGNDVKQYAEHFKGAKLVRIVADQDEVGRKHAKAWADSLRGIVDEVEIVKPVEGKDAHDSLSTHSLDDAFRPIPVVLPRGVVSLATIQPKAIEWFWRGYLPKGKIVDVVGEGDLGKSLVMLDIAARVSAGRPMPDEPKSATRDPRNVVLLCAEDDLADTVVPRLIAAGADMSRITAFTEDAGISFPDSLDQVEEVIRTTDAALLIIDPVMSFLGSGIKSGTDSDVRKAIGPLKPIAADYGCAVMSLRHVNKDTAQSAANRGGGSVAFRNLSRAALAFGPDHDDPTKSRGYMAQSKKNLGTMADTLAYRIESSSGLVKPEGVEGTPIIVWEGAEPDVTAADILGPPPKEESGPRENTKTADATDWLLDRLAGGAQVKATVVEAEMKAAGFSEKVIRSAKKHAGVTSEIIKTDNKGHGYSMWSLE